MEEKMLSMLIADDEPIIADRMFRIFSEYQMCIRDRDFSESTRSSPAALEPSAPCSMLTLMGRINVER